jgi:hypothetical protein
MKSLNEFLYESKKPLAVNQIKVPVTATMEIEHIKNKHVNEYTDGYYEFEWEIKFLGKSLNIQMYFYHIADQEGISMTTPLVIVNTSNDSFDDEITPDLAMKIFNLMTCEYDNFMFDIRSKTFLSVLQTPKSYLALEGDENDLIAKKEQEFKRKGFSNVKR